ncbi:unnamed protein product [Urochloa humidicola]
MELTKHNVLQQLMYAVQIEHMAAAPILLLRLLPLLLLLLPPGLREHLSPATVVNDLRPENVSTAAADEVVLHPIVLVPGVSCSELEARLTDAYRPSSPHCGAMKGKGWFGLWANVSDLPATHYVPCFLEQMRLVYDPDADDYRNLPGVETRVRNFGSSRGFQRNPLHTYGLVPGGPEAGAGEDRVPRRRHPVRGPLRPPPRATSVARPRIRGLLPLLPAADPAHRGRDQEEPRQEGDPLRPQPRRRGGARVRAPRPRGVARRARQAPRPRRAAPGRGSRGHGYADGLRAGRALRPHGDPAVAAPHVADLRVRRRQLPVAGGVRLPRGARGHAAEELLRLRHGGIPRRRRARR